VRPRSLGIFLIALTVVVLDQVSKYLVTNNLDLNAFYWPIPFLQPFAGLVYIHNTGAAFGMLQNQNLFFTAVAIIVVSVIVYLVRTTPQLDPMLAVSLGLLLGGACGNLIDRLRYQYVVDFIYVTRFAISNVADACITLGVVLLAVYLLFRSKSPHVTGQPVASAQSTTPVTDEPPNTAAQ
jgi:signal peptidase II